MDLSPLEELNDFAGTDLSCDDFETYVAPIPFPLSAIDRFDAVRGRLFERYCRRHVNEHDLTISGYNPQRVPGPAVHLIADFSFDVGIRDDVTAERPGIEKIWSGSSLLRSAYHGILDTVLPAPDREWTEDTVLANSRWTQAILEDRLGVDSELLYPPVPPFNGPDDVETRDLGFVALGRVVHEKRTHVAIEILEDLRDRGHDVELTIVGPAGEPDYGRRIEKMVNAKGDWLDWPGRVPEATKQRILAENSYAISARRREPFGIAVAEVLQAGCIPFVPDAGGQTEIVDDGRLTYETPEEAVDRIERVLADPGLRAAIREQLATRRERFTAERFQREISATVHRTLKEAQRP